MDKLRREIICEDFMLCVCIIIIGVYISGLIAPNFYISDFLGSTTITLLTAIIFILVFERHSQNLKLFAERRKEIESRAGASTKVPN